MHPFLDTAGPIVMAHRGGVGDAAPDAEGESIPENSDVAFARCVGLGVRYLESDIRTTCDGVPILHHDEDLRRVASFGARVHDLSWREVSAIRLPTGARLMRLDEALITWPGIRWNLDVKDDRSVEATVGVLTRAQALDRVCVASFSRPRLLRLREMLGPRAATCATWSEFAAFLPGPRLATALARRRTGAGPHPVVLQVPPAAWKLPLLTGGSVGLAHTMGLQVHAWTINSADQMRHLLAIGVDALITDHPSTALQVIADRRPSGG